MSAAFSQTLRSIEADGPRRSIAALAAAALLLVGWGAWLFLGDVVRYEVADDARIEVAGAAHRIQPAVSGRIVAVRFALGDEVRAGDLLVQLDDRPQQLELAEKRAALAAIEPQLPPLRAQIAAVGRSLGDAQRAGHAQVEEAGARRREADLAARFQEGEAQRSETLRRQGAVSDVDARRAAADALAKRAAVDAIESSARRYDAELHGKESELHAEVSRLDRDVAALEGQQASAQAAIDRILGDIETRAIRAPVSGRVGEIVPREIGAFVAPGDPLGAIVPDGALRVVADLPAATAVGRVRPGQPGKVRLDGFPWTEYGTLAATVSNVGSEAKDGRVRVELRVEPSGRSPIPVQHGLPGTVEIEVEHVSPATLVLRAAGQLLRTERRAGE